MNAWSAKPDSMAILQCRQWTLEADNKADSINGYYNSLLGWFFFDKGDFENARPYLEKAANLLEASGRTKKLPGVYNNLAPCLIRLGDYEAAAYYLYAAIRMNTANNDSNRLSINYHNLGRNFNAMEECEKAIYCFERMASYKKQKDEKYYEGMTKAYFLLERLDEAQNMALQYYTLIKNKNDNTALAYQWLGQIASGKKQYTKAIDFYQQALQNWRVSQDTAHYDFGKTKLFLGNVLRMQGKSYLALNTYQSALHGFVPKFNNPLVQSNPTEEQFPNEIWIMEILLNKAIAWEDCYKIAPQKDTVTLKNALECAELATLAFFKMKSLYIEDNSKFMLDNDGHLRFFEKAIQIAFQLAELTNNPAYFQRAFNLTQRSKAGVLQNAIQERAALISNKLPLDSIVKMDQLQRETAILDRKLLASRGELISDSLLERRFQLKRKWRKIQEWANQNTSLVNSRFSRSITEIQNTLPKNTLLIEYFMGASRIYSFAISDTYFLADHRELPAKLKANIKVFLRSVSDQQWINDSIQHAEKAYLNTSPILYNLLLSHTLNAKPFKNHTRLCIVPHGELGSIPFAVLLTEPYFGNWRDRALPILLKKCAISYHYSSALLQNMQTPKTLRYGFGGFGTDYRDPYTLFALQNVNQRHSDNPLSWASRDGLGVLNNACKEIDSLATLTKGKKWLNENASKSNFIQSASTCGILHFALHTIESPPHDITGFYLLFSKANPADDNLLSSNELASLNLNADLAVVNACYSGSGKWQIGEGMMSIGRAFFLSGCSATMVNLWQSNDEVSPKIILDFYKNLKMEHPKDVALQQAQLNYLNISSSEGAIPFFWANFEIIGNIAPLNFYEQSGWWAKFKQFCFGPYI